MQWPILTGDEQQELWNTLEILMHGRTAAEVRCAQQRLDTLTVRQRPYLAPAAQRLLEQVVQAAICASQGGEQRFYWLSEVENRWQALTTAFRDQPRKPHRQNGPAPDVLSSGKSAVNA